MALKRRAEDRKEWQKLKRTESWIIEEDHHNRFIVFIGRPFVKRIALCYRSVVLSVTFVHCGQTVGRIKVKLGMQVGLGPGHIVLNGDPAPLPQKGRSPNFRRMSIVAKRLDG